MYVKFFRERKNFHTQVFAGFAVFSFCVQNYYFENMRNLKTLFTNRLLKNVFVLVIGIVCNSSNGLIMKCSIACLMN